MAKFMMEIEGRKAGLNVAAESAGIFSTQNAPLSLFAKNALEQLYSREFMNFSKPVSKKLVEAADYIFLFTNEQLVSLKKFFPKYKHKMHTISENDVPDPFGGSQQDYDFTAKLIQDAVKQIIKNLKEKEI